MPAQILVVDDEPDLETLIKQRFRRKIREGEFVFHFANGGKQALEILQKNDVDVILSDINMPEMDGLTFLIKSGEATSVAKTVMVSAYGDLQNIRTAMNWGAFDFITKPVNLDDLEITIDKTLAYVLRLRQTMKAIRENNILKMYVDANVLNVMTKDEFQQTLMKNETIEASVMFIDICGFTALSEKLPPDTVVSLLNQLFDIITKEIIDQGGAIDKFIGDAVMAVFRGEHDLDQSIEAALKVREKINQLPPFNFDGFVFSPKVSIGINRGAMVSGNLGSESLKRLDFTVIGDTVNTAQRFQAIAEPSQIVISVEAFEKVGEFFLCEKLGEVKLKNKLKPITIYNVVS